MGIMDKELIKVLVVDDDEDDYLLVRDMLSDVQGRRFKMSWASSRQDALEALEAAGPDVCLLDYRLGENTGLDLLEDPAVKGSNVPVIMMTGQGDWEIDHKAMRAGASDYMVKGLLTGSGLERSIRYAMEQKASELKLREKQGELVRRHEEIDGMRGMLQRALNQVSGLIREVIAQKDFSVRFDLPNQALCNKIMGCARKNCNARYTLRPPRTPYT
jgi:DNA-binding NtrC family response regulator